MKNGDYMTINEEKRQFVESILENFEGKADRNERYKWWKVIQVS